MNEFHFHYVVFRDIQPIWFITVQIHHGNNQETNEAKTNPILSFTADHVVVNSEL